ncbi:hypothetical protein HY638_02075 [Candidatus Woesearchaeota archaeon]|nr:hypothetical protein [Candidatus Woesearchaeota archaeon]
MKKVILLIIVLLVCLTAVSAETIQEKQLEIRQASLDVLTKTLEISMDASIGYVNELGGSTSELDSLKSSFLSKREDIRNAKDHASLNSGIGEMANILKSFNTKADADIKANGGNPLVWLAKIVAAAKENEGAINEKKDTYWEVKHEKTLEIFDEQMNAINEVAKFIEDSGWDMAQINGKIGQLSGLRNGLDNALSSKNEIEVAKAQFQIVTAGAELVAVGAPGLEWAYSAQTIAFWLDVASNALEGIDNMLTQFEGIGIDVSELRMVYSRATSDLNQLQNAYDTKNSALARDALAKLQNDWVDFAAKLNELINSGKLTEGYQKQVEGIISALKSSQQQISKDIGGIK